MRLSWGVRTDRGCVRRLNEDAALAAPPVFVVADGMGGHAAGEVASGLVIECFAELAGGTTTVSGSISAEAVVEALAEANRRILAHARTTPAAAGLGTTVSGVAVVENGGSQELLAFNIGDSRLYRLGDGGLEQVSVDHSAVQELIDSGDLDPAGARTHPARNVVTRALGSSPAPRPDLWFLDVHAGDRFVLGTDGLFGDLPPAVLHDAVARDGDAATVADRLLALALEAGGRDNITTLVLDVLSPRDDANDEGDAGDAGGDDADATAPRTGVAALVAVQPPSDSGTTQPRPPTPDPQVRPVEHPAVASGQGSGVFEGEVSR
jgi:serine/threonine protein phosphatase PrpC